MIQMPTDAEPVVVIQGDCLDVLRQLPDGSVDAVVTDPPYNVGLDYHEYDDNRQEESYRQWCCDWMFTLRRNCTGPIVVSVGMSNLSLWSRIAVPDWWMCWHKPAAMGRCVLGFNNWEPIAVFGKPPRQISDVLRATIQPDNALSGHPCPKPLGWATGLIQSFSEPNQTILDPFAGSGTTGVAAIATGRRAILIEKDPRYAEIARRRIAEAMGRGKGSLLTATGLF